MTYQEYIIDQAERRGDLRPAIEEAFQRAAEQRGKPSYVWNPEIATMAVRVKL